MTDYVVAVPSYQRADRLATQTLTTLTTKGVPMSRVHVFVHDNDPQLDQYRDIAEMMGVHLVVTAARGIGQQRTVITETFDPGTNVVCMDDDIQDVMSTTGKSWADVFYLDDLDALIKDMFQRTEEQGLFVWGLSPVDNPWFLAPGRYSNDLKLVMFTLFGYVNRPGHPVHTQTVRYKDEQEFSLRAWWYDGGVVRNQGVAVKTVFYADGGCQAAGRTFEQVDESVEALMAQWPDLITRSKKRAGKSPWPEVQLSRRKRGEGHAVDVPPPGVGNIL